MFTLKRKIIYLLSITILTSLFYVSKVQAVVLDAPIKWSHVSGDNFISSVTVSGEDQLRVTFRCYDSNIRE